MTTKQKQKLININVKINTPTEEIRPIKSEKLLGIFIQDDLKWTDFIQNNDKSLIKQLNSRLNALKMISYVASFKVRLMIANGIFCSKLIFQISLWGGTEEFLLNSLQIVQNKAARFVARRGIYTPVAELLKQCGWLSLRQLVFITALVGTMGRDQHMLILLFLLQSSNGPIKAKHINPCSSVIGQYKQLAPMHYRTKSLAQPSDHNWHNPQNIIGTTLRI